MTTCEAAQARLLDLPDSPVDCPHRGPDGAVWLAGWWSGRDGREEDCPWASERLRALWAEGNVAGRRARARASVTPGVGGQNVFRGRAEMKAPRLARAGRK